MANYDHDLECKCSKPHELVVLRTVFITWPLSTRPFFFGERGDTLELMHRFNEETKELANAIVDYSLGRVAVESIPLDGPKSNEELAGLYGANITKEGIGGKEALRRFVEGYSLATLSSDNPRFLAFVPVAPTKAATLFDLVVSASSICGSTWIEGAGAIYLENEALSFLASMARMGPNAGGTFVSGGSAGNLGGLVAGRERARRLGKLKGRGAILASSDAHSSISMAARIMDVDVILAKGDANGKLRGDALVETFDSLSPMDAERVFCVAATAGVTNTGIVDDLATSGAFAKEKGLWFHVDGAYGGAGMLAPRLAELYNGIELADSFVVDPHKWLFAPFDCAAIIYGDPRDAAYAMTQEASYLDDVNKEREWNPASYAYHLTRRSRGLPFWFSLATYGTNAYKEAIEATLDVTTYCRNQIIEREYLDLAIEPELTVVVFRRLGWSDQDYISWSEGLLQNEVAFVQPTTFRGERMMRLCFVNPLTSNDDVDLILNSMK
ncbi:L-2,4-diaminobutyrate decarboxylase [Acidithrix ferrooxidans]|uniref:L-2,4-diaminobutyrate decarboxylase n=2 Tax=Acidithrix ferrooxidans TaxID=1280514 RepID=A0A0D8HF13_9ACTN|nr:L-2,4-diaminobutyrate decarboxylase [Acidithrix ferrooxidans]